MGLTPDKWVKPMPIGLRIPDTYEAKIVKICNFWTF